MRLFSLVLSGALVAYSAFASAADLPNRAVAPAFVPPVATWTGCYLGLNVGYAATTQSANTLNPVINNNVGQGPLFEGLGGSGVAGGGQVGCNYQINSVVLGVEGDFSGTTAKSSAVGPNIGGGGPGVVAFGSKLDWLASARGRLGYLVAPSVLFYATGGVAFAETGTSGLDVFNSPCPNCGFFNAKRTTTGWVAGAGIEYAIVNNWVLRAEFLHYDLPGSSSIAAGNGFNAAQYNFERLGVNEGRLGVSYKFGWSDPVPVVARY